MHVNPDYFTDYDYSLNMLMHVSYELMLIITQLDSYFLKDSYFFWEMYILVKCVKIIYIPYITCGYGSILTQI